MAKIKKIYDDSARTTQIYPQTHEKAVVDNNGTTAETKFGLLQEAYSAITQSDIVVVADHTAVSSPQANVIYREQGTTTYSDWMYYDSSWKKMAEYDNAIDEVPTAESDNLVKSGGVYDELYEVTETEMTSDITSMFQFTDNKGVSSSNGELSSNTTYDSSYAHSNFVNIEGATKIKIRLPRKPQVTSTIGVAFYTSNEGYLNTYFISGDKSGSSGSPSALYTQVKELTVPNGAKYIATSWFSSTQIAEHGPMPLPFLCEKTYVNYDGTEKYARRTAVETVSSRLDSVGDELQVIDGSVDALNETVYGSENHLEPIQSATMTGKKMTSASTYASGNGYPANSANANIYIYDLSQLAGKHIRADFSYVSNAYKYLIVSDYTIIRTLTESTESELAPYVLVNGGKGYPAAHAVTTLLIPQSPSYLVLNPAITQWGMPVVNVLEDAVSGLTQRVDILEDEIGGIDGIRQELREGFVGMQYTHVDSINDVWLKYSSQAPIGAKFGLRNVLSLSGSGSNSIQSSALYNNILFIFTTNGTVFVVNVDTMYVVRSGALIANDGSHHNSAAFCGEFYDSDDDFPMLMLMGNGGDATTPAEVLLFRVINSNGIYDLSRIGTLHLPLSSDAFKNNAGASNVNFWGDKLLVEYRCTVGGVSTIRLATFVMPTIGTSSDIYLRDSDILEDWEAFPTTIMQDSFIDGNIMYIGVETYGVRYYDLLTKQAVNTIIPKNINSYYGEMESNFVYNRRLYFVGYSEDRTVRGIWLFDARTM